MRSSQILTLPISSQEYNSEDEQIMRRTIEQYLSDLRIDIIELRDATDSTASLAERRRQFLLMGASNG
jgi:hypothetical protein